MNELVAKTRTKISGEFVDERTKIALVSCLYCIILFKLISVYELIV